MGTTYSCIYERGCKIGYGYDLSLDYIYPFECDLVNMRIMEMKGENFNFHVDDYQNFETLKHKLGSILCQRYLNYLEFLYEKDDIDKYYSIQINKITKSEYFKGSAKYSENFPQFVRKIDYGIHINFLIEKRVFEDAHWFKVQELLNDIYIREDLSKLTSEQSELNCKVLIHFHEEKQMKLKELFNFLWDQKKLKNYEYPYGLCYKDTPNISSSDSQLTIGNKAFLVSFLLNLYFLYRKIEKMLTAIHYSDIPEFDFKNLNFNQFKTELEKLKDEFRNMDERDIIGMYQKTKKLFKCYQAYLNYMLNNRLDIHDEDKETYESWIEKLKSMKVNVDTLVNIKNDLREFCQKIQLIFHKIDYPYIRDYKYKTTNTETIQENFEKITTEFENIPEDEYIHSYYTCKQMYFLYKNYFFYLTINGKINKKHELWNMKLNKISENFDNYYTFLKKLNSLKYVSIQNSMSNYLIRKCPSIICNDNDEFRRWKCSKCDEFMKIKTVECDCGYKQFEELDFYCEYYSRQQLIQKLNQFNNVDKNKNRQAKGFLDLLMNTPEGNIKDLLDIITKYNINDDINEIIKNYIDIQAINKLIVLDELISNSEINQVGYIKSLPVPQKLLIDNVVTVDYLMTKCPLSDECKDERFKLHLCFECKKLTKIKTLKCNCNEEKSINSSHFICDNDQHRRQFDKNVKKILIQQLDKQKDNNEIRSLLSLVKSSTKIPLANILNMINMLNLDGDTKQFIDDYKANSVI